jgi:deazaflavin-dependent oxidoreductase (nitroreductase family)
VLERDTHGLLRVADELGVCTQRSDADRTACADRDARREDEVMDRMRATVIGWLYGLKRWMYRGDRPHLLARVMNRVSAMQFSAGVLSPSRAVTLEVTGRHSGRVISFPVVVADHDGGRYVVSMLGEDANWVRNVRAAGGRAVMCRRGREPVHLEEIEPAERAPILRRYLAVAPGARPHTPVDRDAPLERFAEIADRYPVFRITPRSGD